MLTPRLQVHLKKSLYLFKRKELDKGLCTKEDGGEVIACGNLHELL